MNEPTPEMDELASALDQAPEQDQGPSPADVQRLMQQAQQMVRAGQRPRGKNWKRRIIERRQGKATKAQRRRHSKSMERKARRRFEVVTGRRAYRSTPVTLANTEVVSGQVAE